MKRITTAAVALLGCAVALAFALNTAAFAAPNGKVELEQEGLKALAGAPTTNYETLELGEAYCYSEADGRLLSNDRRTDVVAFTSRTNRYCTEGVRVLSGGDERVSVSSEGDVVEKADWLLELPGGCVYKIGAMRSEVTLPIELVTSVYGAAALVPRTSSRGCAPRSIPARTDLDVTDVEFASIAFTAELVSK